METIIKREGVVKAKSHAAQGLRDLFEVELKDIYWSEKALVGAIQKMVKNASSPELVRSLKNIWLKPKNTLNVSKASMKLLVLKLPKENAVLWRD